jgi:tetratricopeptide (TPR) repeat protein
MKNKPTDSFFQQTLLKEESCQYLKETILEQKPIIFCGAGVSFNSGIPLAIKQITSILESLNCSEENISIFVPKDSKGNTNLVMPFELTMQTLLDNLFYTKEFSFKKSYSDFIEQSIPNANHYFISELLFSNKIECVITTNFDKCIEDAFNNISYLQSESRTLEVIIPYEKDLLELDNIDLSNKLIKLHGCISIPESLGLNMDDVSNTYNINLVKTILEKVFISNKNPVIFLGYSCSDFYDIGMFFDELKSQTKKIETAPIIYFQHGNSLEDLAENPKRMFEKINAKKTALINNLDSTINFINPNLKDSKLDLKNYQKFHKFLDKISETRYKNFILGQLFVASGHFDIAKKYYENSISHDKELKNDIKNYCSCLLNLGNIYSKYNKYDLAENTFHDLLNRYKILSNEDLDKFLPDIALVQNNLGNVYLNQKKYNDAEIMYTQALEIRRKLVEMHPKKHTYDLAMTLSNLGVLNHNTKQFEQSLIYYQESLKLKRNLSNEFPQTYLPEFAFTLTNLGMFYDDNKDYNNSELSYLNALDIYRKMAKVNFLKFAPDVAWVLANLGLLNKRNKKFITAKKYFMESFELRRELAKLDNEYLYLVVKSLKYLTENTLLPKA